VATIVVTQSDTNLILLHLKDLGVDMTRVILRSAEPSEIPRFLSTADIGISFIKPTYSKQSSSPTKIAEYLAAGLPVMTNAGVGDLDSLIQTDKVGILISSMTRQGYLASLARIDALLLEPGLRDRCRESANARFDLETVGGPRYVRLYRRIMEHTTADYSVLENPH
jgi:hypothetical protein